MKTLFTSILAALLTLGSSIQASPVGASAEARDILLLLEDGGYTVRDHYQTGYLSEGETISYNTTLTAGLSYAIVAGGDENALDVDVYVYDENGNLVAQDNDYSARAVASLTPRWTGTFRIVVKMARTAGYGARFVLQTGYQS